MASALPSRQLRLFLTKEKDPVPPEDKIGVISCDCGDHYIGETERTLKTRVLSACKYARFERSAVAEHGHRIDWEGVNILDVASNHQERLVK